MALHTKKDFAKLCGLKTGNLTVYISRGQVSEKDGYVDDSLEINRVFFDRRTKSKLPKPESKPEPEKRLMAIRPDPSESDSEDDEDDQYDGEFDGNTVPGLYKKKLKVDIEKKEREISLLKLRESKIKGEVAPVDLYKSLFKSHNQSVLTSMKECVEEILIDISAETRLSGTQVANIRGKMVKRLNTSIDKSVTASQRNLRSNLEKFSVKRETGEHD
jgi:hypothetical protein